MGLRQEEDEDAITQSMQTQRHLRPILLLKYHDGCSGNHGEAEIGRLLHPTRLAMLGALCLESDQPDGQTVRTIAESRTGLV